MPADSTRVDRIESVAVRACRDGGAYLRDAFRRGHRPAEFDAHDVKAEADREAEGQMLDVILSAFPDHHVYAEESGDHPGDDPYRWIVDPLDGTNNFAAGLPSFASAVTVLDDDGPLVAAVYVPLLDDCYVARRGEGTRYDGARVAASADRPVEHATVAFVVGHDVKLDGRMDEARRVRDALESRCKRVVESWSPCVHWGLLARGLLDGVVTFHPDEEEQFAGRLLAEEAGARHREADATYVAAANPAYLDALWSAVRDA